MEEHIFKDFYKYVSLNILGVIGLSCYILADTFFIAKGLGSKGLTALNLALPIYSFIFGLGTMIGMGGGTRYSILKENNSKKITDGVFSKSLIFALAISIILFAIGALFSKNISALMGADDSIINDTQAYLKVVMMFSPAFLTNNVMISFVRNDNNPKLSMIAMTVGSFANIIMDYIFIFPCGLGMTGAALATGASPVISIIVLSFHFWQKKNHFKFIPVKPGWKDFIDISSLGLPSLITELSSGIVILVFNTVILRLEGNLGVAAYGIVVNVALVVISIFSGIAQGMQPIISVNYGSGRMKNVRRVYKYGIITAVLMAAVIYIISYIFAEPIVSAFNEEKDIILQTMAVKGLRMYFTAFLFVGINVITAVYFSSIDRASMSFIISILRGLIVLVPIILIISKLFGMNGVWLSLTAAEMIVCIVSAVFKIKEYKHI